MEHDSDAVSRRFTIPELAKRSGIGPRRIRAGVRDGELRAVRMSPRGYHLILPSDFERWVRRYVTGPSPRPPAAEHARAVVERVRARESATP